MALNKSETAFFNALRNPSYMNLALLEGSFRKRRTSFIVSIRDGRKGDFIITPHAVLLTQRDLMDCLDPDGRPLEDTAPPRGRRT